MWAKHTATLVVLNIEPGDFHINQVLMSLTSALEWARGNFDKSNMTQEIHDEFSSLLTEFKSFNVIPSLDLDPPADYQEMMETLVINYVYGWAEGWKSTSVANQLPSQLTAFKSSEMKTWVEMHSKLTSVRTNLTMAEVKAYELKAGISPTMSH